MAHAIPRRSAPIALLATLLLLVGFAGAARAAGTIQVTSAAGGSGTCPSSTDCTLREAVEHANDGDVINVPAFHITINDQNDGEIYWERGNLTIVGSGAPNTIVDGGGLSRVFEVASDSVNTKNPNHLTLRNLTVTGGAGTLNTPDAVRLAPFDVSDGVGGAIGNSSQLTIDHVAVTHSNARSSGGGIGGNGDLSAEESEISNNQVLFGTGGGISQHNVQLLNSTVSNNSITAGQSTTRG